MFRPISLRSSVIRGRPQLPKLRHDCSLMCANVTKSDRCLRLAGQLQNAPTTQLYKAGLTARLCGLTFLRVLPSLRKCAPIANGSRRQAQRFSVCARRPLPIATGSNGKGVRTALLSEVCAFRNGRDHGAVAQMLQQVVDGQRPHRSTCFNSCAANMGQ